MRAGALDIKRPLALGAVFACLIACAGLAGHALQRLAAEAAVRPAVLVSGAPQLEEALAQSPFATPAWGASPSARTIWLVGGLSDAAQTHALLEALTAQGCEVRLMLVDDDSAGPDAGARRAAAALARSGDLSVFEDWLAGAAPTDVIDGAAEEDGYLALAQQSAARLAAVLAANEAGAELPLLLWRQDGEWRAITGATSRSARRIRFDLDA